MSGRSRIVTEISSTVREPGISNRKARELVERTLASERIRNAMISIAFVGKAAIARLNTKYLHHSGATDVISFGMGRDAPHMPVIGDIYICPEVARQNARRLCVPVREEIARLVVHGTLHVAGYEHPDDASRTRSTMWKRQEKIVSRRN